LRRWAKMRSLCVILLTVFLSLLLGCGGGGGGGKAADVYLAVSSDHGSPDPPVGNNLFQQGTIITASVASPADAVAGTQYACTGWTGSGSVPATGATNSCHFTITKDSTITWNWKTQYELTISILPTEEAGTITRLPDNTWYDDGTSVTLTALPSPVHEFAIWSGDLTTTNNPETLTMDASKTVTANFVQLPFAANFSATPTSGPAPLTVHFTDASVGSVTSWSWDFNDDGIDDSAEQNPSYTYSNPGSYTVKLTVTGPDGTDDEMKLDYITVTTAPMAKSYGGSYDDSARSIQETSDGGYIVAGRTYSFGAGSYDFWILKLNSDGTVSWQKAYGSADEDWAQSIQQTTDGGYIVAGHTYSYSASYDFWVLKLNSSGAVTWQKTYGGSYSDYAYSIQQTTDGGYIVAGETRSFGAGYDDIWVLKLTSTGTVSWQKTYGGTDNDWASSIQQTSDGGYIVAGFTYSFHNGGDVWVLKLASSGSISWQKRYGGTSGDWAESVQQTSDGGYIVAGVTETFDAYGDIWVLKLTSAGVVSWQKAYGSADEDYAYSVQQTSDGGYIVAGWTYSYSADNDFWLLKLTDTGAISWQKRYGGSWSDCAYSIRQTNDGGYIMAGDTDSFGAGYTDFWVVRLTSAGTITFNAPSGAHMTDTSITPMDTSASGIITMVSSQDSSGTVSNSTATVTNTSATVEQQAP
jgi:uncharacterized delta-60 repeat protein